jgi:transcriptional regulator with XRE-family HTH domain
MQICMKLNENDAIAFGLRLITARQERGWSIATLARRSGVEASQVSKICAGKFRFLNASVMQICTTLDVYPEPKAERQGGDRRVTDEVAAAWAAARPHAVLLADLLDRLVRSRD